MSHESFPEKSPPQKRQESDDPPRPRIVTADNTTPDEGITDDRLCQWLMEAKRAGIGFIYYDAHKTPANGVMIVAKGLDSSILRILLDEEKLPTQR